MTNIPNLVYAIIENGQWKAHERRANLSQNRLRADTAHFDEPHTRRVPLRGNPAETVTTLSRI
jgi:hypothetical protein